MSDSNSHGEAYVGVLLVNDHNAIYVVMKDRKSFDLIKAEERAGQCLSKVIEHDGHTVIFQFWPDGSGEVKRE